MNKRFLLVLAACIVGLGSIFWLTGDSANGPSDGAQPSNHTFGKGSKNVTLVEYGDFQCPACGSYYPIIKQLKNDFKNEIKFQFRSFPLPSHQNAFAAHRAAEAATAQNKFWEMHDILYENQQSWANSSSPYAMFEGYAQALGLDTVKFKQAFESPQVNAVINADKKAGVDLGVNSTPTFFLDGKELDPEPTTLKDFSNLISDAIKAKN